MIKVIRIVTSNYCVPAHLSNTISLIPSDTKMYIIGDNVSVYKNLYEGVAFIDVPIKRNFEPILDIISFIKLMILIIEIRPDIIHSIMTKAGLLAALAGWVTRVKVRMHTFTGQVWAEEKGVKRYFLVSIDKVICRLNTNCLTDSPSQSNFLFENGVRIKGQKIGCILKGSLSGVDLLKFRIPDESLSSKIKENLKIESGKFIIGYMARKSIDKGCIDMLKIFKQLNSNHPNIQLLYIGPDEANGEIQKFFKNNSEMRENIIEVGFVSNHEAYLSLCNVFCLPSHREGFGSVVIDAAALGIPTVGSLIPGLVDSVVNNVTGFLLPVGAISQFSEKIGDLINKPELLREMGLQAKQFAETNFDAKIINKELYKIYINGMG